MTENLTLVRLWRDREPLGCAWIEWRDGKFSLPAADPAAKVIRERVFSITIASTPEFMWEITNWEIRDDGLMYVTAEPYAAAFRARLVTDEYLVETWLKAERKWQESQRKTCRNCGGEIVWVGDQVCPEIECELVTLAGLTHS